MIYLMPTKLDERMETKNFFLIIQTAFLGDVLLSFAMIQKLKKQVPNCVIYYVCKKGLKSAVELSGLVDIVFEVKKKDSESYRKVNYQLSNVHFECIFINHRSFTSLLFARSLKASFKISFRSLWHRLFFITVQFDKSQSDAMRQLSLVNKYFSLKEIQVNIDVKFDGFWKPKAVEDQFLKLPLIPKEEEVILPLVEKEMLNLNISNKKKIVSLFPGSVWQTKRWPEDRFAELATILSEKFQVVLLGSSQEKDLCASIQKVNRNILNFSGDLSLVQTLYVIQNSVLVISNDSGGQHLAALTKTPVLTIFGPTVLEFGYRAWSSQAYIVQSKKLSCRPCGSHGHEKCPIKTHECMKSITTSQVLQAVNYIINS